jgi:aminoglycoside phosphotransferase (APT) family kinase protein
MAPPARSPRTIDPKDLEERADRAARQDGLGRVEHLKPIDGGASSMTFAADLSGEDGSQRVVVKSAPPGLPPVRDRDVLRQARLLEALVSAPGVRVPQVLFTDGGDPPEVPPFFAMTFVEGECVEPIIGAGPPPPPEEVEGRARSAARMLAALHTVRPEAVGLAGEAEVSPEAELDRWERAFRTVDEPLRVGFEEASTRLRSDIPRPLPAVIVHGDYRLGNMLCHESEVTAIIDWELWGRGDPRGDLAWFLLHRDPDENPHGTRKAPGMPAQVELVREYQDAGGSPIEALDWYQGLARFKQAAAGALILKHMALAPGSDAHQARARAIRSQLADVSLALRAGGSGRRA